ncbi:MAG TPA: acyl carrier protein [Stellaceae bacterium]|nr:acyl carrier protein [Stellaceae bacterium]
MMTRAEIRQELLALIGPLADITDETPLEEALDDSFRYVEVALGIEDRLDLRLSDSDFVGITRFGELVDLIQKRMRG